MCLLYRFSGTATYKQFEQEMMTNPLCASHLDHGPYHVAYIFKIPDDYETDVQHFINGRYSKFSEALKEQIRKFYGKKESIPMLDIIDKVEHLKKSMEKYFGTRLPEDSELASQPDINIEIYKPYG